MRSGSLPSAWRGLDLGLSYHRPPSVNCMPSRRKETKSWLASSMHCLGGNIRAWVCIKYGLLHNSQHHTLSFIWVQCLWSGDSGQPHGWQVCATGVILLGSPEAWTWGEIWLEGRAHAVMNSTKISAFKPCSPTSIWEGTWPWNQWHAIAWCLTDLSVYDNHLQVQIKWRMHTLIIDLYQEPPSVLMWGLWVYTTNTINEPIQTNVQKNLLMNGFVCEQCLWSEVPLFISIVFTFITSPSVSLSLGSNVKIMTYPLSIIHPMETQI